VDCEEAKTFLQAETGTLLGGAKQSVIIITILAVENKPVIVSAQLNGDVLVTILQSK